MTTMEVSAFRSLAEQACIRAGATPAVATSLVEATLSAEYANRKAVGASHLLDYLNGFREGRIAGDATPDILFPLPACISSDARGGIAQVGFDAAFDALCERAKTFGIAIFTQRNSYTAGELGFYVRRLAAQGLVAIATANAHAMMATVVGGSPVYGTNPLAFGAPAPGCSNDLIVDQASSATAFVNIVRAAADGRDIPAGWALDAHGAPTTDPAQAMRGALLPFGGYKGANIALMVEVLSAGLTGGSWSLDAGDFRIGERSPGIGLTVIALHPVAGGFDRRLSEHLERLRASGVSIPGTGSPRGRYGPDDRIEIASEVVEQIRGF